MLVRVFSAADQVEQPYDCITTDAGVYHRPDKIGRPDCSQLAKLIQFEVEFLKRKELYDEEVEIPQVTGHSSAQEKFNQVTKLVRPANQFAAQLKDAA